MSYFRNYYIHDITLNSAEFIDLIVKRNGYPIVMTGLMREAVRVGDKGILENRKQWYLSPLEVHAEQDQSD